MYEIKLSKEAIKYYKKQTDKIKRLINKALEDIKRSPYQGTNIKKMQGNQTDTYRYRVGDIRILYTTNQRRVLVYVLAIGNRGDIYK
ncbi:MAG TPA: type II toxin-antitoxin system RelE/ParE family toxin [Clostridiales bacterium]|nr:type II toxin-antitoxin system RelE/ParE family toxin [Clostridiales bacterium]